jgi:hypothetical protein
MTTILTAQFAVGGSLVLSGTLESGYEILGSGVAPIHYLSIEDAMEDFGSYVVARTQDAQAH